MNRKKHFFQILMLLIDYWIVKASILLVHIARYGRSEGFSHDQVVFHTNWVAFCFIFTAVASQVDAATSERLRSDVYLNMIWTTLLGAILSSGYMLLISNLPHMHVVLWILSLATIFAGRVFMRVIIRFGCEILSPKPA